MEIKIEISGTTPLMCNRFGDSAQQSASTGTRLVTVGEKGSPRDQAEKKLYLGHDGKPMIPQPNLFRCLVDAGSFFKTGKSKITTQKSSLLTACVEINGPEIPIVSKDGWDVDTRPVRIPSTGGRILAHRPCFNDWKLTFTVDLDTDMLSSKLFRDLVDAAGKRVGLGDFRPACKGVFGKFVVTRWAEEKHRLAA